MMSDPREFEAFFRSNYRRCFFFARRLTGDDEAARDVVAECFAALWRRSDAVGDGRLEAYLLASVRNGCLKWLARAGRTERLDEFGAERLAADEDDYFLLRESRIDDIEREIAAMPERMRYVLRACYYDKRSYADVASELGITTDGVKKHIVKAMARLRGKFNNKQHVVRCLFPLLQVFM